MGLLLLDYYFIIGIKVEISKKVPLGKKVYCFSRGKEKEAERGKGQKENQRTRDWREEKLEAAEFAGLTQVRGVYRWLTGIVW